MPTLRTRQTTLQAQLDSLDAELHDAETYLQLADTLEGFLGRLATGLDQLDVAEQQRVLRLVVREVLIGGDDDTITIRHTIPTPTGPNDPSYLLRGSSHQPRAAQRRLHGMEQAAGVRYARCGNDAARIATGSPTLIRIRRRSRRALPPRQQALEVKARLAAWLAPRGLAFNEDKTRVVSLDEGFDFLGFNVRRYRGKPLIRPSTAAIRRIRKRLRTELRSLRGHNARAVIRRLNPIIRGWAAYYRTQVSSQAFAALDHYLWGLTYKWALISHRNKPRPWVFARYFGKFNRTRQDRWVFGDRTSGVYLHRFSWTGIVRHQIVPGTASPDDPALTDYWTQRRRRAPLPITSTSLRLHQAQNGRCPICKTALLRVDQQPPTPKDWERWLATARDTITIKTAGAARTRLTTVSYTPTATTAHRRGSARPRTHETCLSRMRSKPHVRMYVLRTVMLKTRSTAPPEFFLPSQPGFGIVSRST